MAISIRKLSTYSSRYYPSKFRYVVEIGYLFPNHILIDKSGGF